MNKLFLLAQGGRGVAPRGGTGISPSSGIEFINPLGIYNIQQLADRIINGLLLLATPIVVIMVLYAAFLFITSGGNPEKINQGRKTILWAAIGYGVLWMARGITFIIEQLLG